VLNVIYRMFLVGSELNSIKPYEFLRKCFVRGVAYWHFLRIKRCNELHILLWNKQIVRVVAYWHFLNIKRGNELHILLWNSFVYEIIIVNVKNHKNTVHPDTGNQACALHMPSN
jgi:hypothetical protein